MPHALLFPGQGSQTPSMRDGVAASAPELLERCIELVGEDPFPRVGESTRFAQPAIFCASLAGLWTLDREPPVAAAGHSLGEFAALVAAGALDPDDALRLVVRRGALMAEAGGGTMLALLGTPDDRAEELAAAHGVSVANYNAPGQVVLSGPRAALDRVAAEDVRAMELGVAGAFHSPAMEPAVAPFAAALRDVDFRAPAFPVFSCASAQPFADPARELAEALTRPVRWTATMRALPAGEFVDVGPGRVLAKLVKRILPQPVHA